MADKTTAQTTIDAVLRRYGLTETAPKPKKQRANGFPGAPRIDRKNAALSHSRTNFRAVPQRPLRIPGRG
ncbi:hypothetical protein [Nocardia brasiliensis]|uniref:hypothetical protein n=1 Tax=Nocardia brasiliensis TaxID=37326 RepID=UPI0036708ED2